MITRIAIRNLACFESWESPELPSICVIGGGNGQGKTSLLDVLKHLAGTGHDPDILRAGAESGEAVVTFSDGNQARVRVTKDTTERSWKPKDGKRWTKSRELIDKLCAAVDYDPLAFLALKPKEQVDRLLEITKVRAETDEVIAAVGAASTEAAEAPLRPGLSSLESLDIVYNTIYKARTALNTGAKDLEAHAEQLRAAPGADDQMDWKADSVRLAKLKAQAENSLASDQAGIRQKLQDVRTSLTEELAVAYSKINKDIDARIAELERERGRLREVARDDANARADSAQAVAAEGSQELTERMQPEIDRFRDLLVVAQRNAEIQERAHGTRAAAETAAQNARAKRDRSKILTEALDRIQALKAKLAERLPFPEITVAEGRIVRMENGAPVPLSRWNTASQGRFALRLAMLHAGDAGFVCVDHLEAFEAVNQQALFEAAKGYAEEKGIQFLFARVSAAGGQMSLESAG